MTNPGYGDLPATTDELGFTPSAATLAAIVQGAELADTPLTVGVYGAWGSGKTSLMRMIRDKLDTTHCTTVWFNAWRYAQQETLWRALLLSVVESLREVVNDDPRFIEARAGLLVRLDDVAASLYRSVEREELGNIQIDWAEAGKGAARTAIRLGLAAIPLVGPVVNGLDEAIKAAQGEAGKGEDVDSLTKAIRRERTT